MNPIRVVLADDEELIRVGMGLLIGSQPDMRVVGEASDGDQVAALARDTDADVVLMDIRMPRMDGITATREVTRHAPRARVIILTTFDLDEYVFDSLRAGASGFLLKDSPRADLLRAVRVVAGGDSLLSPAATRRLVTEFVRAVPVPSRRPVDESVTAREREVLAAIAAGLSNAEVAERLGVSEHTVKTHVGSILAKLSLRDRVQAVIYAYETGLAGPQ
ncbi:response regulator transcription factor [Dactylosporangium sp. NPDC005572]|uniref:response regulator transcription factor n=1 Tax=Dactylosporangium sp. NPDC005572 TaxID=3156889 RepID=UPI0033AE7491